MDELKTITNLYGVFLEGISDKKTFSKIITNHYDEGIMNTSAAYGGNTSKKQIVENLKENITDISIYRSSMKTTVTSLDDLYNDKKKNKDLLLQISIVCISICFIIIIVGVILDKFDTSKMFSSLATSFLSATFLLLHRNADKDLKEIEKEIIKANNFNTVIESVEFMRDNTVKDKNYENLFNYLAK